MSIAIITSTVDMDVIGDELDFMTDSIHYYGRKTRFTLMMEHHLNNINRIAILGAVRDNPDDDQLKAELALVNEVVFNSQVNVNQFIPHVADPEFKKVNWDEPIDY